MTSTERAIVATGLRFIAHLIQGKEPLRAGIEAVLPLLPQPPRQPPPRPAFDFNAWAAAQAQAAKQAPQPPADPRAKAVQKKIDDLEARAVHPNTPEEEARTAAILALRLKHNKVAAKTRPAPVPATPAPTPARQGTRRASPSPAPASARRGASLALLSRPLPPRPWKCAKCKRPIHRGGFMLHEVTGDVAFHTKCMPKRSGTQ